MELLVKKITNIISFSLFIFLYSCGNPKINYYLTRSGAVEVNDQFIPQLYFFKAPNQDIFSKHDQSLIDKGIKMYIDEDVRVIFTPIDIIDIDIFLREQGKEIKSSSRLPDSYYFSFYVSNRGSKPVTFNLYNSYFQDEFGKKYYPVTQEQFNKKFTSPAYEWIEYHKLHGAYGLGIKKEKKEKSKPLTKKAYYTIYMKPYSNIVQIISYEFLPITSKRYSLFYTMKIGNKQKKVKTRLYYLSSRSDQPSE